MSHAFQAQPRRAKWARGKTLLGAFRALLLAAEPMENRFFDRLPSLEMLDDDSLEKIRRNFGIPDSFRIDDDDRPAAAHAKAGGLSTLNSVRTEKQILSLQ
jgi:hypothetical protein